MKITADTNVLVRALTEDHAEQSKAAQMALSKAAQMALGADRKAVKLMTAQGKSARLLSYPGLRPDQLHHGRREGIGRLLRHIMPRAAHHAMHAASGEFCGAGAAVAGGENAVRVAVQRDRRH